MGEPAQWDQDRVLAVIKKMVGRKIQLFAHFHDLAFDDLVQEGLAAAARAWPGFNPAKGSWSTYVYTAASRRLLQMCRDRTRAARRDAAVAIAPDGAAPLSSPEDGDEGEDPLPLAVWLRNVYVAAKGRYGAAQHRAGRKFFSPAQATTAVVLMAKLELTPASAVVFLNAREDLRGVLHFRHVPSESWFRRAWEFARRYRDLDALRSRFEAMQSDEKKPIERKKMSTQRKRPTSSAISDEQLLGAIARLVNTSGYSKAQARLKDAEKELAAARAAFKLEAGRLRPVYAALARLKTPAARPPRPPAKPANNRPEPSSHETAAEQAQKTRPT